MSHRRHIALGTVSFMVCFAASGLIGAFALRFRETFHLTASQAAFLVAVPVLLGAVARLAWAYWPIRFGARTVRGPYGRGRHDGLDGARAS